MGNPSRARRATRKPENASARNLQPISIFLHDVNVTAEIQNKWGNHSCCSLPPGSIYSGCAGHRPAVRKSAAVTFISDKNPFRREKDKTVLSEEEDLDKTFVPHENSILNTQRGTTPTSLTSQFPAGRTKSGGSGGSCAGPAPGPCIRTVKIFHCVGSAGGRGA